MSARYLPQFRFLVGAVFALVVASTVDGQEFYKGKTIVFIVGTAPGGGFDTYSRITARHIGKHIPGNPGTIVQNMPGAGNLIAANYVYNKAEPDGLTVGHFSGSMIFKHILGDQGVMFDGNKFGWLGTPAPERHTCVVTEKTGIKTLEEWSALSDRSSSGALARQRYLRFTAVAESRSRSSDQRRRGFQGNFGYSSCRRGRRDRWRMLGLGFDQSDLGESDRVGICATHYSDNARTFSGPAECSGCCPTGENQGRAGLAAVWVSGLWPVGDRILHAPGSPKGPDAPSAERLYGHDEGLRLLTETKKASLVVNPIDGPTISNIVADLYNSRSAAGFQISGNYRGDSGAKITRTNQFNSSAGRRFCQSVACS